MRRPSEREQPAAALCGDGVVLVDQSAEAVATTDVVRRRELGGCRLGKRRTLLDRAVRTLLVVMPDVSALNLFELAAGSGSDPVEAFASQASHHPAFGVCLRPVVLAAMFGSHGCPRNGTPSRRWA
jgi:hypothetical protein